MPAAPETNASDSPTVSVIMPTFNDGKMLEAAVESVLRQTYADFELLIIDDASTVDPEPTIRKFSDPRIRFTRLPTNVGAAKCRNHGVEMARGRYIAFIDGDDLWAESKLERQIAYLEESSCGFVYSKYLLVDADGNIFGSSENMPSQATYKRLLMHCFIRTSSLVYDTHRVKGKHWFPDLRRRQDYGLFLSLLKISDGELVDDYLCSYRVRSGSISSDKVGNIKYQWAVYRSVEHFGVAASLFYMMQWFLRAGQVVIRRKLLSALHLSMRVTGRFQRRSVT